MDGHGIHIFFLQLSSKFECERSLKSLDGPVGELLSEGEELGEVDAKSFIYRLIKVIIDVQGI